MIKLLEKILYEKTKDTQSEILFSHWNYDKKLIPPALNAVSSLFPHYSLHDETHSITIINNIVRVIGKENLEKLTAIDIWLILEASYSHDLGMVVTSEELINSLNSMDFINYFKELMLENKTGLQEFTTYFEIVDNKIIYRSKYLNLEAHDGIKYILAEYFRKVHADRSKEVIDNPDYKLSLYSPRGVIPTRIFKILGDICAAHTKNFDDVLKLPFSEVGIDIEDAHPRFVACLLRIGDLLDLDNNRFSEVMLRTLSKIPIDTLNHKGKHLSIESFRIDNEKIDILAKCNDYETATITQHWFDYLNSEIISQKINWSKIVPNREFGFLPSIENLKVELKTYNYIDAKLKPKFRVDVDKALNLLQGAAIYESPHQSIREILQNSVDSTFIRAYLENKELVNSIDPTDSEYKNLLRNFPVKVNMKGLPINDEMKGWHVEIIDSGTGISENDLKYMMNTGSSSKNKERKRIIDSMPTWMQPSGTFGIGFQSIYMLTDKVKIETKSFFTEKLQIIELHSPGSDRDGDILLQSRSSDHSIKPGTKLEFDIKTSKIPSFYEVTIDDGFAHRIVANFDPFTHESFDIEAGKIMDEVIRYSQKSPIPIILAIDGKEVEIVSEFDNQFDFYFKEECLEMKILNKVHNRRYSTLTFYKGQPVESRLNIKYLDFHVNIHKDKASDVLTLNRNQLQKEYNKIIHSDIIKCAFNILKNKFHEVFIDEVSKAWGSMFLSYYSVFPEVKEIDVSMFNEWENFVIQNGNVNMRIKDLIDSTERLEILYPSNPKIGGEKYELNGDLLQITIFGPTPMNEYTEFLLSKFNKFISFKINKNTDGGKKIIYSKESISNTLSKDDIEEILTSRKGGFSHGRSMIPCIEEYSHLRIKDDSNIKYVTNRHILDSNIFFLFPKMLSPFITKSINFRTQKIEEAVNDKLYDWVFDNRYDEATTKEDIIRTYDDFLLYFSPKVTLIKQ